MMTNPVCLAVTVRSLPVRPLECPKARCSPDPRRVCAASPLREILGPEVSEENVEIVRALAEGFQHRQHERAFEFYDPEIEWDATAFAAVNPDLAAVYHGHEGVT